MKRPTVPPNRVIREGELGTEHRPPWPWRLWWIMFGRRKMLNELAKSAATATAYQHQQEMQTMKDQLEDIDLALRDLLRQVKQHPAELRAAFDEGFAVSKLGGPIETAWDRSNTKQVAG